ncbi:MAG: holo-ACP synthase [Candidatus Zeuxoniibacter abyssi]|nr:MAG: holo-ACP synthase [Candidatus Persebacteraceae bacterium AB1(2)]
MITGIGNDLVALPRLRGMLARHPQRLPARLLCESEAKEFMRLQKKMSSERLCEFLAARVAAKEALGKALGVGLKSPLTWRRVGVAQDKAGRPFFIFSPELSDYLTRKNISICHLSLSHDGDYAAATVVAEQTT